MAYQEDTSNELLYRRYLRLLGLPIENPTLPYLTALTAAHLDRIPFENISKLVYLRREGFRGIVPLEVYLDGIERCHFGGTCYANAGHFSALLRWLGFDARLCGADMDNPDVHAVNIVAVDGREYLIDVGYGAPLWTPLPLDAQSDIAVDFADDRYLLHPRLRDGTCRVDHLRYGEVIHGYTAKSTPRTIDFFAPAVTDSFRPAAHFLNTVCVARYSSRESVSIRPHLMLRQINGELIRKSILSRTTLDDLIEQHFSISRALIAEALNPVPFDYAPASP